MTRLPGLEDLLEQRARKQEGRDLYAKWRSAGYVGSLYSRGYKRGYG